jgi:hypothetical protein
MPLKILIFLLNTQKNASDISSSTPHFSFFRECIMLYDLSLTSYCFSSFCVILICILYHAQVKIIKCLVDNIAVDISFNQVGGLCTLCFLEEVCSFQIQLNVHILKICFTYFYGDSESSLLTNYALLHICI